MRSLRRTFGGPAPTKEELDRALRATDLDRTLACFDAGTLVATAGILTYEMTVPGGRSVPTAGVTRVTVLPTHRRRGILTAMMRRQLSDIHERGEPLAALYASEAPIYGRFGYGLATYQAEIEVDRHRSRFRPDQPDPGQMRLVDASQARPEFQRVWESSRLSQVGMLKLRDGDWDLLLADNERFREGATEHYRVLYQQGGSSLGFILYRLRPKWTDDQPDYTLEIEMLIASTPAAYARLWRYCLDVDLISSVKAQMRPSQEPLRFLLEDPRAARTKVVDGIWLRLVDCKAALSARKYAARGRLVLQVEDEVCPWNHGRLLLNASEQGAECRETNEEADLLVDVSDLAAIYLGANPFSLLATAGRVRELRPGAVAKGDLLFHSNQVAWCPSHF